MHLVYPPKLCITIVFDFSWDDCNTLENLETMVMQNSEGENKVHYGLYESSDYKRCKVCVKLSYLTDNLVPRSPRSCAGLRKWRLRDWPTRRAQEGPLKLPDERQSLKRKENWRKLLILGIQPGDKLAKPPFFVAYSRLCRHCRNLAKGACRLSRFHFRPCCYFLGHVACRNLLWQGLMVPILVDTNPYSLEKRKYGEVSGSGHVAYTSSTRARIFPESNICCGSKRSPCLYSCSMWTLHLFW